MRKSYGVLLAAVMMASACGPSGEEGSAIEATAPPEEAGEDLSTATDAESETGAASANDASDFDQTDYADTGNWLCHPDKAGNACDADLSYTVVQADGTTEVEEFEAAENPPLDCFYVYPTVSLDESANSDLTPGDEERRVIESQFARFGATCRLFAPMYRQITLPELRRGMTGQGFTANLPMRYADVKGAWDEYLENYNDGRGVVLIGHSQGSSMLQELVKKDIAGSEAEDRVVSLMPIGMTTYVDAETGNFGPYEPCQTSSQTGCILSYVSFRSTLPPPPSSRFASIRQN